MRRAAALKTLCILANRCAGPHYVSMQLGQKLHELYCANDGEVIPGVPTAELGDFQPGDICHDNVRDWLKVHPGHRAVRGWLASNGSLFDQHSVVDIGSALVDVTPRTAKQSLRFIRHPGSEEDFWRFPSQVIWIG